VGHEGAEWYQEQGNKICKRCMIDDDIDDYDCERLRDDFTALRTEYQEHHGRVHDNYRIGIEEAIKTDPRSFLLIVDRKKKQANTGERIRTRSYAYIKW
jgi:hypothetical protein